MRAVAASVLIIVGGCSPPATDCQITGPCGPVVEVAFASLQESFAQRVDRWVVEPTQVRLCMDGEPIYDVTFMDDASGENVEVTVAKAEDGRLYACTY
jgi:hypothetical protein